MTAKAKQKKAPMHRSKRPWPPVKDPEELERIAAITDEEEVRSALGKAEEALSGGIQAALHPPYRAAALYNAVLLLEDTGLLARRFTEEQQQALWEAMLFAGRICAYTVTKDAFASMEGAADRAAEKQDENRQRDDVWMKFVERTADGSLSKRVKAARKKLEQALRAAPDNDDLQALDGLSERRLYMIALDRLKQPGK